MRVCGRLTREIRGIDMGIQTKITIVLSGIAVFLVLGMSIAIYVADSRGEKIDELEGTLDELSKQFEAQQAQCNHTIDVITEQHKQEIEVNHNVQTTIKDNPGWSNLPVPVDVQRMCKQLCTAKTGDAGIP